MNADLAGLPRMLGLVLRRSRLTMLIWLVVLAGMTAAVIQTQHQAFPTQESRDAYAAIANTPAVASLTGLPYAAGSLGGILNIKLWMTNAIVLALVCSFLVTRHGRAEEEAGRTELLRSGALGRHAPAVASWIAIAGFSVVAGLACAVADIAMGLPAEGSLVQGASFAGLGIAFVGIAAVTNQLSSTARGANAMAGIALAAAYLVRALADVKGEGESAAWYTWLSPIGWAQQMRSFGADAWWPLALLLALGVVGCAVALALEARRDLGAGIIPDRPGPAHAAALTRTVLGLPLRLQRTALISWTAGIAIAALFFGSVATLFADLLEKSGVGGALGIGDGLDDLLGYFLMAIALLTAAFAVQAAVLVRTEEADGRAELLWAAAVSRVRWAAARLLIPALGSGLLLLGSGALLGAVALGPGDAGRFAVEALAFWPPVLLLVGVVALLAGWAPRIAVWLAWAAFAALALVSAIGEIVGLPHDVVAATPFQVVRGLGADGSDRTGVWILSALAVALVAAGLWGLRRRDATPA